jgi:small subunit ribosomal protein S4e
MVKRAAGSFLIKPNPGAHAASKGFPLGYILRDLLHFTKTLDETKKLLNHNEVLVDGKRRKDLHFQAGLFDVVSIPKINGHYRLLLDQKGRIRLQEISAAESTIKICKVIGKTILPKKKVQYHLHDGKNLLTDTKAKVGDSLVLALPKLEIKEVLELKPGAIVFFTQGKHAGDLGKLKEIRNSEAVYLKGKEEISTAKEYLVVVGMEKTVIEIKN